MVKELGYTMREATAADVETIVHHRRAMFESMGFGDPVSLARADREAAAFWGLALPTGAYGGWLVVAPSGEVVGGAGLCVLQVAGSPRNPSGRYAYLASLYVEPAHRRRGIARAIMRTMIEWARSQGIIQLALHASDEGRPLHESLGFRPTNEMRLLLQ